MYQIGKKLCAIILALCIIAGIVPVGAFGTTIDGAAARFVSQQLNLGDDLTMNFNVSVDDAYADSAIMTVTVGDIPAGTYAVGNMDPREDGTYRFSVNLAAAQMTENITLTLTAGEETLAQKTYTVQNYAKVLLEGNYSDETKSLVKQMLNYGAKAQIYFAYNTDSLANSGYELDAFATVPTEEVSVEIQDELRGIGYYGASVVFESKMAVRFYFDISGGVENYVFLANGMPYTAQSKGDLYYIEVPGINPQDMDTPIEVIVSDGEDNLTISYSPMCYITRMYNKETTGVALKELLQAAYGYYQAAAVFTGVVEYCTVSFSDGVMSQTVEKGTLATEPAQPIKTGYSFLGWYNGDEKFDFNQPITEDILLTAKWAENVADVWNDFGDSSSASVWTNGAALSWLESYDGAEGVLKIEKSSSGENYIGSTNSVNWPAMYDAAKYSDVTALSFRVKTEGNALNTISVWGLGGVWRKTLIQDTGATDGWAEFTIQIRARDYFETMNGLHLTFWSNGASTLYIDQITVIRTPLDLWNDFSDSASASVWTNGASLSWLENYDGARGVLKMENTGGEKTIGNTNGINWPAVWGESHYAAATAVKFRIRVEGSGLSSLTVWGQNYTWSKNIFDAIAAPDGWVEYTLNFDGASQFAAMNGMFLTFWSNGASTIYIDEITVEIQYTVSFSDGVASQTVPIGSLATEPEALEKEGYNFLGWYNGDTKFDFSNPVTSALSLTAKWEEINIDLWNDFRDELEGILVIESTAADAPKDMVSTSLANVWCAPATVQVLADQSADTYADVRRDTVYLDSARNEYESGQILVSAKSALTFTVSVSDLVNTQNSAAIIGSENCTVYIQKYVTIAHNQHGNGAPTGKYPDALLPQENAVSYGQNSVEKGANGGAWLSFFIPEDTLPGSYTGTATVTLKGSVQQQVSIPICLQVYDVEIPEETTSKSLFTINSSALADYEQDSSVDMQNKYIQFLVDHRLAPSNIPAMSALAESGDSAKRVWAKTVWYWYEKGLRTIPLSAANATVNGYAFFDTAELKECLIELAKLSMEKGVDLVALTSLFDFLIDEPFYVSYTAEHVQNNIDAFNGVIAAAAADLSALEEFKSPLGQAILESVRNTPHIITDYYGNEFRVRAPMVFADGTTFSYEGQNVALCPKFDDYHTQTQRDQYDLVSNTEKWWYGCNTPSYPYPSYHTDDTPVSAAVIGWMMADYGVTGNLYWAINCFYKNGSAVSDPYSLVDTGTGANGEGMIVYPGRYYGVDGPVGTIRTSSILDGNEDYELIRMIQTGYEAKGLSAEELLEAITSNVYDGTKVFGGSREFEEGRKTLLYVAEAMADGIYFSAAEVIVDNDSEKCFVFTEVYENSVREVSFHTADQIVGSSAGVINWGPINAEEKYSDAIGLIFRVKVEGAGTVDLTVYGHDGAWKTYGKLLKNQAATGGWKEYTLNVDVAEEFDALSKMFFVIRSDADAVVYVDEITVVHSYTVSFSDGIASQRVKVGGKAKEPSAPIKPGHVFLGWYNGDTEFDFTQVITGDTHITAKWETYAEDVWHDFNSSSSASVWTNGATLTWLESYEGATGVLKIEKSSGGENIVGSDSATNWTAAYGPQYYANATAISFRVKIEGSGYNSMGVYGRGWGKSFGNVFKDQLATDGWQEFVLPVSVMEDYDLLSGMFLTVWSNYSTIIYIDEIKVIRSYTVSFSDGVESQTIQSGGCATEPAVSKYGYQFLGWYNGDTLFDFTQPITSDVYLTAKWEEIRMDLWYDFSDSSCASIWNNGNITVSHLESYDGAEGVLKLERTAGGETLIGNTNGINWPSAIGEAGYANVTGLKFRVKIESSALSTLAVWGRNYSWCQKLFDGIAAPGGWVEYTISVDGKSFSTVNGIWLAFWSNGASTIYIDEITVVTE